MSSARILLGEITGVHGIKGDVVIRSYTADPIDIAAYGALSDAAGTTTYDISPVRSGPKGVVARIAGIADRTAAERLRGTKLFIERALLPEPQDDAFYFTDLIGLAAVDAQGVAYGRIVAVHNFGAGDLIEVKIGGQRDSELVPFSNAHVPTVDLHGGTAVVLLPETLDGDDAERPPEAPADEKGE